MFVVLQLTVCRVAAQESKAAPSETLRAFLAWRDAIGLKDTVVRPEERFAQSGKYLLIVDGGHLETVIGQESAQALYERLFLKLLTVASTAPQKIELQILSREEGYCGPPVIQNSLQINHRGIARARKVIQEGGEFQCMLDFEAIRRYENQTKSAIDRAGINAPSQNQSSAAAMLTIETLRRIALDRYTKRGGRATVTGFGDNWLSVVVRDIQTEVISTKKYWERLQLMILMEPVQNGTRVRLIVDGKYGAGLAPPSEQGYVDMEPEYASALVEYGKALALFLAEAK